MIKETWVLKQVRNEYGKQIRKAYESHQIHERRGNMTTAELRTDGLSNTITTVLKDNTLFEMTEGTELQKIKAIDEQNMTVRHETFGALTTGTHGDANPKICTQYRIRKLTPRECWRLMDFSDEDFEKAEKVNSNTQLYKQAGNSIVCNVLVAILGQMFSGKENIYKERDKNF